MAQAYDCDIFFMFFITWIFISFYGYEKSYRGSGYLPSYTFSFGLGFAVFTCIAVWCADMFGFYAMPVILFLSAPMAILSDLMPGIKFYEAQSGSSNHTEKPVQSNPDTETT